MATARRTGTERGGDPLPEPALSACLAHFGTVDGAFIARKEFYYSWRVSGDRLTIRVSDYLEGAPDDVVADFCDMVCRRARRVKWSEPQSYLDHVRSDGFILSNRPTYVRRSRNLLRTEQGEHHNLLDSVQRLLDCGLLTEDDIRNSYISWTRRDSRRRVGFCSTMFRVVGISARLDAEDVPDSVRDYVVYHECLHLRQGYRPVNRTHDAEFHGWERSFPGWREAEAFLKRL